jgi:hypothetical protein
MHLIAIFSFAISGGLCPLLVLAVIINLMSALR